MARDYGKIYTSIWGDPEFRALGRDAQHLYMQLLSQPDLSMAGVLTIARTRWAQQAGVDESETDESMAVLTDHRFVFVDWDTQELLVRSFVRRDEGWRSPTTMKAIASAMNAVLSPILKSVLADEVRRIDTSTLSEKISEKTGRSTKEVVMGYIGSFLASVIPHSNTPSDTPSDNPSDTPTDGFSCVRARTATATEHANATAPANANATVSAPRQRGHRLPAEWRLSDDDRDYAVTRGIDADTEAENFRDYWHNKPGKDGLKLDWSLAWKTWIRKSAERRPANSRLAPSKSWTPPAGSPLSYVEM